MWKNKTRSLNNFTLLEMVVVLAVAAILMGISLPAFTKLIKGQNIDVAARSISGTLKACRAYAVTNRQYVALIMPQARVSLDGSTVVQSPTTALPQAYFNQSYRPCIVTKSGSTYTFSKWIDGEKWEFTPTGALILRLNSDSTTMQGSYYLTKHAATAAATNLYTSGTTSQVLLTSFTDVMGSTTTATAPAIIFKPNGSADGPSRYLFFGEGVYTGTLTITNPNENAYVALSVNQYTGRVHYGIQ